jgi:YHS domain-containing protein
VSGHRNCGQPIIPWLLTAWLARSSVLCSKKGGRIMAKDVVCGMEVDEQRAAARREYRDRTYYFCSLDCLRRFKADPAHYAVHE